MKKGWPSPRSAEHQAKLTAAFKARWASGTRKPSNTAEAKAKLSRSLLLAYAEGRKKPPVMTTEQARERRSRADPEKVAAGCRRMAAAHVGQENPPGPSAKGVNHWRAKYWVLLSPDRVTLEGWNLSHLIRSRPDLFDPSDTRWRGKSKTQCRAQGGISTLAHERPGQAMQWKGWRLVYVGPGKP